MAKKRAFVKYTKQGRLIPGSLILTAGSYPIDGLYTEVPTNICCDTDLPGVITASPKGWVRYTKSGQIVPGSLIVGKSYPKDGVWKEVVVDLCCDTAQYYRVAGCERMEYHTIRYTGTQELIQGTIVSNDTPECWYVDSVTTGPADVGTISTIWSTDGECSICTTQTIGTQEWTSRNLDVDRYRNGDIIPEITDPAEWVLATTGAWCYYNNDSANGPIYGKLYNNYAVTDPRGLAPVGYHVPTKTEWETLITTLGGGSVAGGELKETGLTHWKTPNTGATNSSAFTALGGGGCDDYQNFLDITETSNYWTSTSGLTNAYVFYLLYTGTAVYNANVIKTRGYSVRLLRD